MLLSEGSAANKRKLRRLLKDLWVNVTGPTWVRVPESLQIDTQNYCNLRCEYCNVKQNGSFKIPRGRMPTDMIKYIIRYWGRFREMRVIAPFVNGEPMLDTRLPDIFDYTQTHSYAYNLVDTNGTVYENRWLLVHPNLKIVRFTISANTFETYKQVHGVALFHKALATVEWFRKHRFPQQQIRFNYIVTKHNMDEIEGFIRRFKGFLITVFPLHRMPGIQLDSEQALGMWREPRPITVFSDGTREVNVLRKWKTCQGMSFAVMWNGLILHCTDAPPKYNYGHVYDVDMLEAWHRRNKARVTNPACQACNAKRSDWKQVLQKWLK